MEKKKKILIVEDEVPMREAVEEKLAKSGFRTTVAPDGEKAIKELKNRKFDFIVLDLVMPHKDGFQVLEEMKNMHLNTPVAVLSNLSEKNDVKSSKDGGSIKYFVKARTSMSEVIDYINENLSN